MVTLGWVVPSFSYYMDSVAGPHCTGCSLQRSPGRDQITSPVAATSSTHCCPHHHRACVGVACGARVSPPVISRVLIAGENSGVLQRIMLCVSGLNRVRIGVHAYDSTIATHASMEEKISPDECTVNADRHLPVEEGISR